MNTPVQPPPPPPAAAGPQPAGLAGPVTDLPADVSALLSASRTVAGTVQAVSVAGQATIRTDAGTLVVQLPAGTVLPPDTPVTLQFDPRTQRLQVSLARPAPTTAPPATPDVPVLTTLTVGTQVTATVVAPGTTPFGPAGSPVLAAVRDPSTAVTSATLAPRGLPATVVVSGPNGALSLQTSLGTVRVQAAATLPVGTNLLLQAAPQNSPAGPLLLLSVQPGTIGASASGASAAGASIAGTPPAGTPSPAIAGGAASQGTAQAATAPAGTLTPGTRVPVRIAGAAPPGTSPAAPVAGSATANPAGTPPAPALPLLDATVIGVTGRAAVLVETPAGQFSLPTGGTAVPVGTRLLLAVTAPPQPGALPPTTAAEPAQRPFAALQEALGALHQADAGLNAPLVRSLMPQVNLQLAPALLFLLNAIRLGAPPRWLGPQPLRAVESNRRGVLDRMERDFAGLRIRAADSGGGDWRGYQLPVQVDGALEPLRLFVRDRQEHSPNADPDAAEGNRFIVEVNFTRLGPFQFDTLVHAKHVQLLVRTHSALSPDLRDEIRGVFANAVETLGLTGTVGYHVSARFDVTEVRNAGSSEQVGLSV